MSERAHLAEWQRRSFDISSGTCAPRQTADAHRAHLLSIQYAWASSGLSPAAAAALIRGCSERYAATVDSDDPRAGLNNYAEGALHLARGRPNRSDRWGSALTADGVREMACVRKMMMAGGAEGGRSPVAPADAEICVGGGGGGGGGGESGVSSLSLVPPPAGVNTGFPKAESGGRGALANPLGGAAAERARGSEGVPGGGSSARPLPARAASLFSSHDSPTLHPPPPPVGQSVCFPSSFNPNKRKNFYSSSSAGGAAGGAAGGPGGQAGSDGSRIPGSFKTAREQLIVEQQKKHQRGQQPPPPGATKRSLGANRPRGNSSRFVSPVPKQGDEEEEERGGGGPQEGQFADERLKNFEPKIIELIMSEIMDHGPPVAWEDIAGLEFAKATIKEIVVWPMLRPDIFTGLRGPPKGILLFGPPGTGKTLIGKCIACQSGATFFSISASSLTSKWVGEGEKMVRALFAIARCHQPAVIFIDEIDSLLSQRTDGEHDASRRIKTEFLVQLDGAATSADDRILVVGATNRPQEIDEAARRRLSKRLYIPLPEPAARRQIVAALMAREKSRLEEEELGSVVDGSEGFSGADMTQLCREAALGPIRSIRLSDMATIAAEQVRPILYQDFQEALNTVRPSVSAKDLEVYQEWNKTFGCGR